MERLKPSAVREILKVAERPDILSFAGGLPAPELFPMEAIAQAHAEVLADRGPLRRCSTAPPRASPRCASGSAGTWPSAACAATRTRC